MGHHILIADDETEIRELLRLYLEKDGYTVWEAADGMEALALLKREKIDLAILDIMMPPPDGYRILQNIRRDSNIPVILLSAKSNDSDKILGLDLGADDYIAKPFVPLEAVARVHSALRRFYEFGGGKEFRPEESILKTKTLQLDLKSCLLHCNEEKIVLTSVEFRIMKLFMENPGKVFTKQQLFEQGWEESYMLSDNNVMVCISKLRAKMNRDGKEYIRTIRGLGYRLEDEDD